jgi:mannan endo-1,4-beta-mannosidase
MVKAMKKMLSLLSVGAIAATMCAFSTSTGAVESDSNVIFHDECENLTLNGLTVWKDIYGRFFPGYSGEGFVYLTSGSMEFTVDAPEDGMYEINTSYVQVHEEATMGPRTQTISVNGLKFKLDFPYADSWTDYSFGIFRLNKGENTIQLLPEYGYASFDTITVEKATLPELKIQPTLADKKATKETQGLMNYLCDMYGNHIISGQQEIYGGGHTEDSPNGYSGADLLGYESEFEWIKKNFGAYPAIRGFDMINVNPLYGWDDGTTERIIEWGTERNGIPTVCWHINLPNDFTNYEVGEAVDWSKCSYKPNSSFSVANATVEGTKENEYIMSAIDLLAQELLKVQDAGVPIIFRPYHEAEGNPGDAWFWWGQDGAEPYKALWKQLYTTLTEDYGIHNLIWEFNSYTYSSSPEWYPGDDCVDIVGYDKYNTVYNRTDGLSGVPNEDAISGTFYNLVNLTNNKKLVAMPENDTVPSVENMLIEKANWLYFCIWYDNGSDNFLSDSAKYNNFDTLKATYESDYCITLDELPDWKNYVSQGNVDPTEPTTGSDIDFVPGDTTDDGKVNVFDSIKLRNMLSSDLPDVIAASAADTNGDGVVEVADLVLLNQWLVGKDVEITYYKPVQ